MFAALAGLAAGFFHVLAGPDHLAAVAPLAVERRARSVAIGVHLGPRAHGRRRRWSGLLLLAFREMLPVDALSAWSERLVGLALVGLGAWGVWRARYPTNHAHPRWRRLVRHGHVARAGGQLAPVRRAADAGVRLASRCRVVPGRVRCRRRRRDDRPSPPSSAPWRSCSGHSSGTVRRTLLYTSSVAAVIVGGAWLLA